MSEAVNPYGLSQFLVHKVEKALVNAEPSLFLTVTGDYWWRTDVYTRIYLRRVLQDGQETFYMSSDEPMGDDLQRLQLAGVMTLRLDGFDALINDLTKNTAPSLHRESVHGPPSYVYYDIALVADHLKPRMLNHLTTEISGYSDDYFEKHFGETEKLRIKLWKEWLRK